MCLPPLGLGITLNIKNVLFIYHPTPKSQIRYLFWRDFQKSRLMIRYVKFPSAKTLVTVRIQTRTVCTNFGQKLSLSPYHN